MCKTLKYLEEHPYKAGLGILLSIASLFWAVAWSVFTYYRPSMTVDTSGSNSITKKPSPEYVSSAEPEAKKYIGSIFDLTKEILNEPITIKKKDLYKMNIGLQAQDFGYITDIKDIPNGQYPGDSYKIAIDLSSAYNDRTASVQCRFTESWRQTILSGNFLNKKIQFKGTINGEKNYDSIMASDKNIPLLVLTDCNILQ